MLLPTAFRKSWIYQVLLFIVSRDTSPNKIKIGNQKFYFYIILSFIPDWESETVNQSELQTNLSEN